MTFPSKIFDTLALHLIRNALLGFFNFLGLKYLCKIDFSDINYQYYILAASLYAVLSYIYLGIVSHDFVVYNDRIEVLNRIPLFEKERAFYYKDIKLVFFRHEWTEELTEKFKLGIFGFLFKEMIIQSVIPPDYKWIKIVTDKPNKFYCFGLEFDYYDNKGPLIEDLFFKLYDYGVKVRWTNIELNYYASMMNRVNKK